MPGIVDQEIIALGQPFSIFVDGRHYLVAGCIEQEFRIEAEAFLEEFFNASGIAYGGLQLWKILVIVNTDNQGVVSRRRGLGEDIESRYVEVLSNAWSLRDTPPTSRKGI